MNKIKEWPIMLLLSLAVIALMISGYQRSELERVVCIQSDIIRNVSDIYEHDSVYNVAQYYLEEVGLDTNYLKTKCYMY